MIEERCDTCRFWSRGGRCRRYPPSVVPLRLNRVVTGFEVQDIESATPATPPDYWCGEYDERDAEP